MRPLRLCFLGWGDHVHLERWAGYFASAGHDVSVLSVSGRGHYPPGVRQYTLHCTGRRPILVDAELRLLLWRLRPDIVHVHWAHFAVAAARVWLGPLAVTAWGSDIYRQEEFSAGQWAAMSRALVRADLLTCDSDDLANAIVQRCGLPEESVNIVQWGVDTDCFSPGPSRLTRELGIAGRPVVFSARSFRSIYNQETVVEAFALARRAVPSAFLLLKIYGGDPEYLRSIRERIKVLGIEHDCFFVDKVPYESMPDLYRAARVTVSVPLSDGTPMSLLEAMACGSVPLLSDLPSLRPWITDGENGFLAPATNVEAVARCMVRGLTDDGLRDRATLRNRQLVLARASQAFHMRRCEELYREAVQRHGSLRSAIPA